MHEEEEPREFLGQKKPMDLRHMSKGRDDGRKGQSGEEREVGVVNNNRLELTTTHIGTMVKEKRKP
jgi:hypothetical protein